MSSALAALLQLAVSLLVATQSSTSVATASQKQQASIIATQVIQIATQALQSSSVVSTTTTPIAPVGAATVGTGLPVRLIIPKLNINAAFQYNGMTPSGTMETPSNVSDVGWFTGSVLPGKAGVSIVIGHVAQIRGGVVTKPGVFSDLGSLSAGDTFSVVNDQGVTTNFVVRKSRSYDPTADATDVFISTDGGAHLNFITCEGTWDRSQLEYTQRRVVFADVAL
jgi:sortase (surface protein transpeptidase)